jgi:hypothetical protein
LIHETGPFKSFLNSFVDSNNNLLHFIANSAPQDHLNVVSAAPLQNEVGAIMV